jgi:surface antigen
LLTQQRQQHDELASNQAEVNRLLALAESNAAAADADVRNSNTKITQLKQQQAALLAAASRGVHGGIPGASGGSGGACDNGYGNGGYPMSWCNSPQDSISTPWGYSRECVSWAGWRRNQLGRGAYAWGNANTWDDGARAAGFRVDYTPEVGAIAQTDVGSYGHVAVVEAVDGGDVVVSEMNYDGYGHFRWARYSSSYFKYIH